MSQYTYTTQAEVRAAFWEQHPQYGALRRPGRQNAQVADVRMGFCDFVEALRRDDQISEALAQRVTL